MPTWGGILEELADSQKATGVAQFDEIRRKYLVLLHQPEPGSLPHAHAIFLSTFMRQLCVAVCMDWFRVIRIGPMSASAPVIRTGDTHPRFNAFQNAPEQAGGNG